MYVRLYARTHACVNACAHARTHVRAPAHAHSGHDHAGANVVSLGSACLLNKSQPIIEYMCSQKNS